MGTYHRTVQLKASSQRRKDAEKLIGQQRWTGGAYLAGYMVECALKSWICYAETRNDFLDTKAHAAGLKGSLLHRLPLYLEHAPPALKRAIASQPSLKTAWNRIAKWDSNELRYGVRDGTQQEATELFEDAKQMHDWILRQQNETYS
jgi:hypothetical protein